MTQYPQRYVYYKNREVLCQILNWSSGEPPKFIVCHPLESGLPEEFIAAMRLGTWMEVSLCDVLRYFNDRIEELEELCEA